MRPAALLDAYAALTTGVRRSPAAAAASAAGEGAPEARPARAALLEAERVLLAALEFDTAVEQPYPLLNAVLQSWRRETAGADPKEKRPELAALERAAADIILASMATDLPLLFSTREIAYGCLFAAYQLAPAAVRDRLRITDAAFAALLDHRMLEAFVDRLAGACEELGAAEEAVRAALAAVLPHQALHALRRPAAPAPNGVHAAAAAGAPYDPLVAAPAPIAVLLAPPAAAAGAAPAAAAGGNDIIDQITNYLQ